MSEPAMSEPAASGTAPEASAAPAMAPRVGARQWLVIILLGLSGQIAWNVENNWFNTFVYDKITPDPAPIAIMTAVSAAVATVTTLIMGAASDRVGRRKPFIAAGYVLWALSTAAFPLPAFVANVGLAVFLVVVLDSVMTFFGSTANDASFNAWVTDVTAPGNRGLVEGVLNVLPVLATMIGMGLSGIMIDRYGYVSFFLVLGGIVLIMGIVGSALVRDAPHETPAVSAGTWATLAALARPSEIRSRRDLYLVFATMAVVNTGLQVTLPFEVIYLNYHVGISKSVVGLLTAVVAPVLIVFALPIGRLTDRGKGFGVLVVGYVVTATGLVLFSTTSDVVWLAIFAALKSVGFLMIIVLGAWHRNLIPEAARGAYQGVRLIFMVMLPMIIGPAIGTVVINAFGAETVMNGQAGRVPPPALYWVAAVIVLLALVPVALLRRHRRT